MSTSDLRIVLRDIRRQIGSLDVQGRDAYDVRAAALTILFNAEHAAVGTTRPQSCPHCASPHSGHRFAMPVVGGKDVLCTHDWHNGVTA